MTVLSVHRVAYAHPSQPHRLFENLTFDIQPGDRLAIVGPNGAGKTTLLRLLTRELAPSEGELVQRAGTRVGYVAQESQAPGDEPLASYVFGARPELQTLKGQLAELEPQLHDEAIALTYAMVMDDYLNMGGYDLEAEVERVLDGLGFEEAERALPMAALSSGQRARAELARLLLAPADLLLLDEPTNHLDGEARSWLEDYLDRLEAAVVLVSHDRGFLSRVAKRVIELKRGEGRVFEGGYAFYREHRALMERQAMDAYEAQQRRFAAAERAAEKRMSLARDVAKTPEHLGGGLGDKAFYGRKAAAIQRTARILRDRPLREPPAHKPRLDDPIPALTFPPLARASDVVLQLDGLGKAHGDRWLFEGLSLEVYRGERLALTGPNGTGKTTLLRVLMGLEAATAGTVARGANVTIGYYAQEGENLDPKATALDLCRELCPDETWVRTILGCLRLKADHVTRPVGTMSAGERGKVALARLLLSGANVLVLDEPTNHLDLDAREALEGTLAQFPGAIVFVSHDEAFVEAIGDRVFELG